MKIRGSIIGLVAIVVILIAMVLWHWNKQLVKIPPTTSVDTNTVPSAATVSSALVQTNKTPTQVVSGNTPNVSSQPETPPLQDKVTGLKEILQANDVDIVFYGRLEDQFGSAVGNTIINFSVRYENVSGRGVKRGQVTADGNGFFTISGYRGQDLSVVPEKPGYVPLEMKGSANYSPVLYSGAQRAHPDPNNPVVIKMWKQQGGEPLIHFSFNLRIPRDSTPVNFDLHTGTIVNTGGDLVIRLQCPLNPDTREQYDWQAIVQPVDGGIMPNNERLELMFQAPDSGYESEFDIKNEKDVSPWSSTFHGGFYFKSHGETCCGKFDLGIVIYAIRRWASPNYY